MDSCPSFQARVWAATACPVPRATCPGSCAASTTPPDSYLLRMTSTNTCRSTWLAEPLKFSTSIRRVSAGRRSWSLGWPTSPILRTCASRQPWTRLPFCIVPEREFRTPIPTSLDRSSLREALCLLSNCQRRWSKPKTLWLLRRLTPRLTGTRCATALGPSWILGAGVGASKSPTGTPFEIGLGRFDRAKPAGIGRGPGRRRWHREGRASSDRASSRAEHAPAAGFRGHGATAGSRPAGVEGRICSESAGPIRRHAAGRGDSGSREPRGPCARDASAPSERQTGVCRLWLGCLVRTFADEAESRQTGRRHLVDQRLHDGSAGRNHRGGG